MEEIYKDTSWKNALYCLGYIDMRYYRSNPERKYEIETIIRQAGEKLIDEFIESWLKSEKGRDLQKLRLIMHYSPEQVRESIIEVVYRIDTEISDPNFI